MYAIRSYYAHLISNGNQAVLEASDFIDVLVDDSSYNFV